MDPHEVLGVPATASDEQVRAAYRRLVRLHHPDRHVTEPDDVRRAQAERMAEVTGAYTLLNDPTALARYRANRARAGRPPGSPVNRPAATRTDEFDYRRAAASEFTPDDDPTTGRWGRTPSPRPAPEPAPPRPRSTSTGRTGLLRVANAIAWLLLLALVVGGWLLGTDSGRRFLDDVRGASAVPAEIRAGHLEHAAGPVD